MTQLLLAAHIGGTKARLGLRKNREQTSSNEPDDFLYKSRYPIGLFQNPATMLTQFIQEAKDALENRPDINIKEISPTNIEKVCLALAGPIYNNKCDLTSWKLKFDGQLLEEKLKFKRVALINDFQAVAYGVRLLRKFDKDYHDFNFWTLQEAASQKNALIAVIGVATGLGKSFLIQASNEQEVYAYATEGGHINFAPRYQFEFVLFQYILNNIQDENYCLLKDSISKRVSVERVVSGRGILAIYRFLQDCQRNPDANHDHWSQSKEFPDRLKKMLKKVREDAQKELKNIKDQFRETFLEEEGREIEQLITTWIEEDNQCCEPVDPAAVIASAAIRKSDPLCIYTMQTFLEITAAVLGNCALHFFPYGGLYLAGGIPPQILPLIKQHQKTIIDAFSQKGRLIDELTKIPIYVVKNLEAGLIGAAYYAEPKM